MARTKKIQIAGVIDARGRYATAGGSDLTTAKERKDQAESVWDCNIDSACNSRQGTVPFTVEATVTLPPKPKPERVKGEVKQ